MLNSWICCTSLCRCPVSICTMHYAVSVKAMIHCVTEVLLSPAAVNGCERHDTGRVVRVMFTHSLLHTMEIVYEHNKQTSSKQYNDKENNYRFFRRPGSCSHTPCCIQWGVYEHNKQVRNNMMKTHKVMTNNMMKTNMCSQGHVHTLPAAYNEEFIYEHNKQATNNMTTNNMMTYLFCQGHVHTLPTACSGEFIYEHNKQYDEKQYDEEFFVGQGRV